ncbi:MULTISPECIES: S-layer homology domain-containing protein [Paenibacillus]|uniref:SLH domain-containing protein n=3 Tax=Paenibacillus TaxID=44249 RepID=A0A0U2KVV2_9BACL|nr:MULTISPECIES: S-layer homology domain-containing protein [Paenibacillus]ALS20738.1 SLH domain-containing protein [Paenibacillus naphthalenovorans]SDI23754.1 S-layer homology domain-containing protein [Paenibacillus naphthalenovorans]
MGYKSRLWKRTFLMSALVSMVATAEVSANVAFSDLNESYAAAEISRLAEAGFLNGYEDGTFRPAQAVTRADLAKILVLSLKLAEDPEAASEFEDVPEDAWYRGYVGALAKSGITRGTSQAAFSPNEPVTREQIAGFFIRAFGLEDKAGKLALEVPFTDIDQVSDWAKPYVALAYHIGFIQGIANADGTLRFAPGEHTQRQALARLAFEFNFNRDSFIEAANRIAKEPSGPAGSGTGAPKTPPGSSAGGGTGSTTAPGSIAVQQLTAIDQTTVEVTFNLAVSTVSSSDFAFDNGLTVQNASLKEGSGGKVIVLTTSTQTRGTVYTLSYKGRDSGVTVTGALPVREIQAAVDAIEALPSVDQLTLSHKQAVTEAREKVEAAKSKGAVDTDFANLNLLQEAEAKITDLESSGSQPESGQWIQSAFANIGGQRIAAEIGEDNVISFTLPGSIADSDRFTGFSIQASPDVQSISVTAMGMTKSIAFDQGTVHIDVSQILGGADPQGDGVSVSTLRSLAGGTALSIPATVTLQSGGTKQLTLVFNP